MDLWSDLVLPFLFFILWSMDSLFTSSWLHGSSILSYRSFPFNFFLASLSWVSRQTWQHGLAVMAYMYSALGEDLAASHSSVVKKLRPDGLISDIYYFNMQMISYCLISVLSMHTFQDFLYFREECEFIPLQVKCRYCHTVKSSTLMPCDCNLWWMRETVVIWYHIYTTSLYVSPKQVLGAANKCIAKWEQGKEKHGLGNIGGKCWKIFA